MIPRQKKFKIALVRIPPLAVGIFFLLSLLAFQYSGVRSAAEERILTLLGATRPLANFFQPFRGLSTVFQNKNALSEANQRLHEENRKLLEEVATLEILRRENSVLRDTLRSPLFFEYSSQLTVGRIMGSAPSRPEEILYVALGSESRVAPDDVVALPQKTLLGKVAKMYTKSAAVETLVSPEMKFAVTVGRGGTQGIFHGGKKPKVSLLSKGAALQGGDVVFTSGEEGDFPSGFLVGRVKEVVSLPAEPFQEVFLELPFSVVELSTVIILQNPLRQ